MRDLPGLPTVAADGALYLGPLDARVEALALFYARFMDGWVARVVASTRYKLRGAIAELRVEKHPGKTPIGRVKRGFDFLGFRSSSAGLC